MDCLGNEQRSFCHFWNCIQLPHLSWNSSTLATSREELTHWKRPWCWEGLGAGGEANNRGWDGCMASPTRWAWVWVNSGSWWWTGRPGVLWFMGSQRVRHDWVTELTDWTDCISDSLVDYEGYSISCKGFLPTVIDIMVIWVKPPPFQPGNSFQLLSPLRWSVLGFKVVLYFCYVTLNAKSLHAHLSQKVNYPYFTSFSFFSWWSK